MYLRWYCQPLPWQISPYAPPPSLFSWKQWSLPPCKEPGDTIKDFFPLLTPACQSNGLGSATAFISVRPPHGHRGGSNQRSPSDNQWPECWILLLMSSSPPGTFFILYDFIKYFKKDNPSFLPRKDFLEIIDTIFGTQWPVSQLEKDAIIFQVWQSSYLHVSRNGWAHLAIPTDYF